ncbi:MAG: SAM-dependent methyltransferase [Saprospiraceae bacterium]|nr:SAM-dependent methyltransferase [Saprospiraceae bacterium]MCB9324514.1 SAM-dependent methyltransferase [Lewinellaceae bacterium]
MKGKLYLFPVPLGEDDNALHTILPYAMEIMHRLDFFIAERARTARRFIKRTGPQRPISDLTVFELDKHDPAKGLAEFMKPALEGNDIGLLSEAGCPGVADPGARVVKMAHEKGIQVVPLVGPSSLLLALMASGMNGQSFCFHGYLPNKGNELSRELKRLETISAKFNQTQLFIETPYRNAAMMDALLNTLGAATHLAVAVNLTLPEEQILSMTVAEWQKMKLPDWHKQPAVFLLYAGKL